MWIAQAFYDAIDANDNLFTLSSSFTILALRKFGTWVEILLIASPVIAVIAKLFLPQLKCLFLGVLQCSSFWVMPLGQAYL